MKLTNNFSLWEAKKWYRFFNISFTVLENLKQWIEDEFNDEILQNVKVIAQDLQQIRDLVNEAYPNYNGKIGIRATSWFRPFKWEKFRKRSGLSQHVKGHAVDFIVVNVSTQDFPKIMDFIWKHLNKGDGYNGGLARLYKNKIWSFIHIDRGRKRRWNY